MWSGIALRVVPFMAACAFALVASANASNLRTPIRVASLNLCTDELVLLIAAPSQIVAVTHLARNRHESSLWEVARRFPPNDGSIASVAGMQPDVIVTMGGIARDRARLADRIGAEIIVLDYPASLDDVEEGVEQIAAALNREVHGQRVLRAIRSLRENRPYYRMEGVFVSGGGQTHAPDSLGAQWLSLAGIDVPKDIGTQLTAERMLTTPPSLVIRSNYRSGQASRGNGWLGFRFLERAQDTRTLTTDGRLWTCAGPLLVTEIVRLRRALRR